MKVPYARQSINTEDIEAVVRVLTSDFLTQGPCVEQFEAALASYSGAAFGVAMNSATSALHAACLALGLQKGDVLWTSPISFVASANCALYCGATVDFVDIDLLTHNMCTAALAKKFEAAAASGDLPSILLVVHFSGEPAPLREIKRLADRYGCRVIEDASHAVGGRYESEPIGACQYSDITVFSFHPVKIITTGEGGMAMTNCELLAKRMRLTRSHGVTRDASEMEGPQSGQWYYEQTSLGYNYRMNDISASLGSSQLKRVDEFVAQRHRLADRYDAALAALPICLPVRDPDHYSALHLYVIRVGNNCGTELDRTALFDRLRNVGVSTNVHYIPIYRQPYYAKLGYNPADYPSSETYYDSALSLPMYASLTADEQDFVCSSLAKMVG